MSKRKYENPVDDQLEETLNEQTVIYKWPDNEKAAIVVTTPSELAAFKES